MGFIDTKGLDDRLDFGKWKGYSVRELLTLAPSYLVWVQENVKHFQLEDEIYVEAIQCAKNEQREYELNNSDFWGVDPYDFMD